MNQVVGLTMMSEGESTLHYAVRVRNMFSFLMTVDAQIHGSGLATN